MEGSTMNQNSTFQEGNVDDGVTQRCVYELFSKIAEAK
jgi:hypothetical protein